MPVWADGSLLEGSPNREGTKYIPEKGKGLLWSTIYVGSVLAAQRLARESEGEKTVVRSLLPEVVKDVLKATRLDRKALLFLDSLHGDGPTLEDVEACGLHYLIGANKLVLTQKVLQDQPEFVWEDTGSDPSRQIEKSGICVCQIQCAGWKKARTLIGKRWMLTGTFLYHYAGVLTDLEPADVKHIMNRKMSYAASLLSLYNRKMGMEDYYKEPLEDLGLHHPPCQEYELNAGFYAVAALVHVLGRCVDLLGGDRKERGETRRKDGKTAQASEATTDEALATSAASCDAAGARDESCPHNRRYSVGRARSSSKPLSHLLGEYSEVLRKTEKKSKQEAMRDC